jgi:fatty-acyl-CoA synthase
MMLPIEHLYQGLDRNPNGIAAIDADECIDYRELVTRVEAFALGLLHHLPANARVALCAQNHIDHLLAHLALVAANMIWIPINPKNGAILNAQLLSQSRPELILVDTQSLSSLPDTDIHTELLDHPTQGCRKWIRDHRDQPFLPTIPAFDAPMGIKFTGGTTGQPKGVVQTHGNVAAVIDNMQAQFQFTGHDRNLAVAPLTHGGSHYIFPLLSVGGSHHLLPRPDVDAITQALATCTVSFMPPTLIYKLLDQAEHKQPCRLRHLTYSAAPMPPEKINEVIARFGPCLSTLYGQTEAPMTITAMSADDMQQAALQHSVGRACKHSELAILDPDGRTLPPNKTGEVAVRGAIVMPGYLDAPRQDEEVFKNGWLLTGDLGYVNDDGYLFLQGRSKEVIISGGFNVYPAEVENALMQMPNIRECAAFGVEDDYWGERVEAAICLRGDVAVDPDLLKRELKALLGDVKTPKSIHVLKNLPRNPVGKVVRRDVKALCLANSQRPSEENPSQ